MSFNRVVQYQTYSKSSRITFGILGLVLVGLAFVSLVVLTPDARGMGTHRQLGLPPCMTFYWTGVPCPSCGMTTAWAYGMRGEFYSAMKANVAGLVLLGQALFSAPVLFLIAFRGTPTSHRWFSRVSIWCSMAAIGIAIIQWALRLAGISLF
jgi:hypothetical protein